MSDVFNCGKGRTMKSLFGVFLVLIFIVAGQASAMVGWPATITWVVDYDGDVLPTDGGVWAEVTDGSASTDVSLHDANDVTYLTVDTTSASATERHYYDYTGFSTDFSNGAVLEMRARMNGGLHTGGFTVSDDLGFIQLDFYPGNLKVIHATTNYISVDTSVWHTYGLAINGTEWSVYIDGNMQLSGTGLGGFYSDLLQFGDRSDNVSGWNADIDYDYFRYADGPLISCSAPIQGDVNNDCQVNLDDFALMALNWLQCNLVPVEACP